VLQRNVRNCDGQNTSRVVYYRDITHEIEVNRMKSDFLSTAAHELRTPMASVMGFSELLLTRDYPVDRQRELLSTINRQSKRLTQLLNELLDLARIEARRGEDFERKDVPVRSIVDDTLAALMMPGDSRVVQFHPCDEPVMIVADAAKIQQALTNILSNAYKYSPNGGDIHLTMIHDASAERIGLCVEDSGLGMTPEQTAKAFERFFRADASCNIPGTGLGLALVREIITLHGGTVDLESEYGKGTRITLWIPIATSPLATAADAAAHAAGITTPLNAEEA
jgi:signal transduction histidine kinase